MDIVVAPPPRRNRNLSTIGRSYSYHSPCTIRSSSYSDSIRCNRYNRVFRFAPIKRSASIYVLLLALISAILLSSVNLVRSFGSSSISNRDWDAKSVSVSPISAVQAQAHVHVKVRAVQSRADVVALADLRYDEWILPGMYHPDSTTVTGTGITTRGAFQAATAEIYQERVGATAFLASLPMEAHADEDDGGVVCTAAIVVGAAELSPIELEGAIIRTRKTIANVDTVIAVPQPPPPPLDSMTTTTTMKMMYVTDVVTARDHRRKGVAQALMAAIEEEAAAGAVSNASNGDWHTQQHAPIKIILLLHVDPINTAALRFYKSSKLGYSDALPPYLLASLDTDKLAENAGTQGQILLFKTIEAAASSHYPLNMRSGGGGFGTAGSKNRGRGFNANKKRPK